MADILHTAPTDVKFKLQREPHLVYEFFFLGEISYS